MSSRGVGGVGVTMTPLTTERAGGGEEGLCGITPPPLPPPILSPGRFLSLSFSLCLCPSSSFLLLLPPPLHLLVSYPPPPPPRVVAASIALYAKGVTRARIDATTGTEDLRKVMRPYAKPRRTNLPGPRAGREGRTEIEGEEETWET